MKPRKLLYTFIILLVLQQAAQAQTGDWAKAGNTLNGTEKLGSKNKFSIKFFTNNKERMILDTAGRLGIGTTFPGGVLHAMRGDAFIKANGNSIIVAESSSDAFMSVLAPESKKTGILFGTKVNGIVSQADGGIIYNEQLAMRGLEFNTGGNLTRMTLTGTGSLGLGTISPKAQFHLFKGNSNQTPHPSAHMIVESDNTSFINMLTPNNSTSGLLFGNGFSNSDGGIVYNSAETVRGLQFNSGGNNTRMVVASNGFVGIGTKAPAINLHLIHANVDGGSQGFRIQNAGSKNRFWTFSTRDFDGILELFNNTGFVGHFDFTSGDYISTSDARRKKEIDKAPDVLEKVMQLHVKRYYYLENKPGDKNSTV